MQLDACDIFGPALEGISGDDYSVRNEQDWQQFVAVSS
jgi:hypothetical protein